MAFPAQSPGSVRLPSSSPLGQSSSSPTGNAPATRPRSRGPRSALPDRQVTNDVTIEDVYVDFILGCNPAVPVDTDTTALREAFRAVPKSDSSTFSMFALFGLVKLYEEKEIKTWGELVLRLGVTPPDQNKNQSSQKIQQYAVRLKRWLHSMHADAFFNYLQGIPHPYWEEIPTDPNPVCEEGRDGVAPENDLALRALIPELRPRRGGRRKPDDDLNKSPSQRPRLESPVFIGEREGLEPWTAHPDGSRAFLFPPLGSQPKSAVVRNDGTGPAFAWPPEADGTPFTAYPQSAITPMGAFWAESAEPRSAITPASRSKINAARRHGAKVVSSAWRSGGSSSGVNIRGRPPMNRIKEVTDSASPDKGQGSGDTLEADAAPSQTPSVVTASAEPSRTASPSLRATTTTTLPSQPAPPQPSRLERPGLSLLVPPRPAGSVRLATPPPAVLVNGEELARGRIQTPRTGPVGGTPNLATPIGSAQRSHLFISKSANGVNNEKGHSLHDKTATEDDTNVASIQSYLVSEILAAAWYDAHGNLTTTARCDVDEARAIARAVIASLKRQAVSDEAFLESLTTLMGGRLLRPAGVKAVSITRLVEGPAATRYSFAWELQYGAARRSFEMTETVGHDGWKRRGVKGGSANDGAGAGGREDGGAGDDEGDAAHWKAKYEELLGLVRARDARAAAAEAKVLEALRDLRHGD